MLGAISRHSSLGSKTVSFLLAPDPLTGHPNPRMLTRVDEDHPDCCKGMRREVRDNPDRELDDDDMDD